MMIEFTSFSPPQKRDATHLMADFVELLCLANPDGGIGLDEAVTAVYRSSEFETERDAETGEDPIAGEELDGRKDHHPARGADWFSQMAHRQISLQSFYPFCVIDGDYLTCKYDLKKQHLLYIFFLLCANLRVISRRLRNSFAANFETIAGKAFESYLPGFMVHQFGKARSEKGHYSNKLADAIGQLADYLHERNICERDQFAAKNTGDGGLDLVAFKHPCENEDLPGSLICFAQCACGPDNWERKQHESSHGNWKNRINFIHRPANFMFTPVCFRDSDGKWFQKDKIMDSILMDRPRLLQLIKSNIPSDIDLFEPLDSLYEYAAIT